ncbi:MAG: hypothetical protein WBV82_24965 [Myxococcaceae bacterium]
MAAKKTAEKAAEKTAENSTETSNGTTRLPAFVKDQIEDAQKRLTAFEAEAQKVLETLLERGRESRRELENLVKNPGKKANQARLEARKRLDQIQNRVIETVGVASQAQVEQINKELVKLSKKLDQLVGNKKSAAKSTESR